MLSFIVDFSNLVLCHFSFLIVFQLSQLAGTTGGEFKSVSSSGIVYAYLSTPIGKPFLVSVFLCSAFFLRGDTSVFFRMKEMESILSL